MIEMVVLRKIKAFEFYTRTWKGYLPPKSCMPRRAKTTMKRNRRKIREMMDFMEFIRETTRFLRDAQYLDRNQTSHLCKKLKNKRRFWF